MAAIVGHQAHSIESDIVYLPVPILEVEVITKRVSLRAQSDVQPPLGTIPVVHATGGLDDSVTDVLEYPDSGTGFKFGKYEPEAFLEAIKSALELFRDSRKWIQIQKRAMAQDFSWDRSATQYIEVYEKTLMAKRSKLGTGPVPGTVPAGDVLSR